MEIPRNDMLPDESQTQSDVSEDVKTQTPKVEDKEDAPQLEVTPKQVKTPENELLAALKEERKRRKELEDKVKDLESSVTSEFLDDDSLSIEGKMLKKKYDTLEEELASIKKEREQEKTFSEFPQLKDKSEEFQEFLDNPDNAGMSFRTAAKVFCIDRDLLDKPSRKGLEKPTGGDRSEEPKGISASDIDRLMKTQPRKFIEMVRSGKIKAEEIR